MSIESIQTNAIASSQADKAKNKIASDLSTFLTLLTTQLKNQDPLSPLKSAEFTNQLVSFANVEQSIAQSKHLEKLVGLQKNNEVTGAVNYIGKTVEMENDKFYLKDGADVKFSYILPKDAKTSTLSISNSDGEIVYTGKASSVKGEHIYTWDGKKADGGSFEDGVYNIKISAIDNDENTLSDIKYYTTGKITGVEYGDAKTTLMMGQVPIDIGNVTAVVESKTDTDTDT